MSGYGLTEAPIVVMATTTDPDQKLADTEGRPTPGVELIVVALDGTPGRARARRGRSALKGPQVIRGYLDPSLDAEAFDEEGYFRSGDLGIVDEDGFVTITGRLKDVIIRHGENISAKEVEDLLYGHPAVADVAVIGLPDPKTGERACAVVAVAEGETLRLRHHGRVPARPGLRVNAVPEQLELVDEVPRNPAGKILKHTLRERFARKPGTDDWGNGMSPVRSEGITLGQGGEEHDAADAVLAGFLVRRFEGRVAVVTGAGSGIGRGTARRLAAEGASVAALDVSADAVAETVAGIAADGGHGRGLHLRRHLGGVGDRHRGRRSSPTSGPPTVVCNVAGIGGFYNTEEMPFERWQQILAVNLTGPFLVCRAALPHLLEHGGSIVNVASNTALMGQAYSAAYCASKGGAADVHQGAGRRVPRPGGAGQRGGPGRHRHPAARFVRPARGRRSAAADEDHEPDGLLDAGRDRRLHRLPGLRRVLLHDRGGAVGRRRAHHLTTVADQGRRRPDGSGAPTPAVARPHATMRQRATVCRSRPVR